MTGISPDSQDDLDRRRTIEELLVAEYDAVHFEMDCAQQSNDSARIAHVLEGYIRCVRRLREFLKVGEIPEDIRAKLDGQQA